MSDALRITDLYRIVPDIARPLLEGAEYPWQVLVRIKDYLWRLVREGVPGYIQIADGVLAGEGVDIAPTATILPPAILGAHTEVRPGAFLRGAVLTGEGCVIGNSSEIKNAVLMDGVQIPHYNYVGDSVLGHRAHLGAGSICSNLKSDGRAVVIHATQDYETGLRKVGAFLGDFADVGCSCVLNPGTVIGMRTSVYPLTAVRGAVGADCIVKDAHTVVVRRAGATDNEKA